MKKVFLLMMAITIFITGRGQTDVPVPKPPQAVKPRENDDKPVNEGGKENSSAAFTIEKSIAATSVKNQSMTGTCWCFSTTSLIESQCIKNNFGEFDLSEMYSVRNIYFEKAKNYILRQGHTQFGEGGLGHDLIRSIATYGAMPEEIYSGLKTGRQQHNHVKLVDSLKHYLDSIINIKPVPDNWLTGYKNILNDAIGMPPENFKYKGRGYTAKTFAAEVLKFKADDYVNITSFTHHNYYEPFVLEVPDNFSNGSYYNIPLNEMIQLTKDAINSGYSVLWDADVSNSGFQQKMGSAVDLSNLPAGVKTKMGVINGEVKEGDFDADRRQALFENLTMIT
jgi:bleomycin hydrolase